MWLSALIFGLLGSFHCVGMCGPIAFMLPVSRDNPWKKFFQIFLYHSGRLLAYSLIGLAFGIVGKSLQLFGLQQQLSIVMGVLMLVVIFLPTEKFQKNNFSRPIMKFIGKIKSSLGSALKKKSADTFLTIGFLNGFLPCGLVYMAVFGAIAVGNIFEGGLYMLLFGLGTIPLMTATVYSLGMFGNKTRQKVRKLIPVFIAIVAVLFILRGLGLGIPYVSPAPVNHLVSAQAECH